MVFDRTFCAGRYKKRSVSVTFYFKLIMTQWDCSHEVCVSCADIEFDGTLAQKLIWGKDCQILSLFSFRSVLLFASLQSKAHFTFKSFCFNSRCKHLLSDLLCGLLWWQWNTMIFSKFSEILFLNSVGVIEIFHTIPHHMLLFYCSGNN